MDGETTLFVGGHYEITNPGAGQIITKYYMAGGSRVALRKGGTLSYMLADHIGSTSLVTDANGNRTSELRYKPWGETRFSFGTMPTKYTFTGQFSYTDDPSTPQAEGFGLMYYNARWMDQQLGRFAQADTIIPPGAHGYDRFAYASNNPIRFTDPTGHCSKTDEDYDLCIEQLEYVEQTYSVNILGTAGWTLTVLIAIQKGMAKLSTAMGTDAFEALFSGVTIQIKGEGMGTTGNRDILIGRDVFDNPTYIERETVHELAHIWDDSCNDCMSKGMMRKTGGEVGRSLFGFHPYFPGGTPPSTHAIKSPGEDWAESVTAFLYPGYSRFPLDPKRQAFVVSALANPFLNPLEIAY